MKRNILDYETPHVVRSGARRDGNGTRRNGNGARWGRTRHKGLFGRRIVALILSVVLAVSAGIIALIVYAPFNIRLKKTEYYMLVLSSESTLAGAKTAAEDIQNAGGAGYVISDGEFRIVAFAYQKRADADVVLARLQNDYPAAEVLSYSQRRTKIKRFGSRPDEKMLKEILEYPAALAEELLGLVYALDTFSVTESGAMPSVDALKASAKKMEEDSAALYAKFGTVLAARLAMDYYAETAASLNQIGIINPEKKLSVSLKSLACEIVHRYYLLREKLEILY